VIGCPLCLAPLVAPSDLDRADESLAFN
jgi:hypothetical protein